MTFYGLEGKSIRPNLKSEAYQESDENEQSVGKSLMDQDNRRSLFDSHLAVFLHLLSLDMQYVFSGQSIKT
jgi:hypothetical protein